MYKFVITAIVLSLVFSCKETSKEVAGQDASRFEINTEKWPRKTVLDPKVEAIIREWPEFLAMDGSFDALYNVANKEDLRLTIDNIIEEQKLLEKSTYPEEFDIPQIKSRQKVFKTYALKVKGDIFYYLEPEASVNEMIESFNILRQQFNAVVSHTIDAQLILDGE